VLLLRVRAVVPWPRRCGSDHESSFGACQSLAFAARRSCEPSVLHVLLLEVLDAFSRGVSRGLHQQLDLRTAALDSVRADGDRHDVALAATAAGIRDRTGDRT